MLYHARKSRAAAWSQPQSYKLCNASLVVYFVSIQVYVFLTSEYLELEEEHPVDPFPCHIQGQTLGLLLTLTSAQHFVLTMLKCHTSTLSCPC